MLHILRLWPVSHGIQKRWKKELSNPWHTNSVSISTASRTISLTRSSLSFVHQWQFHCIPRLLSFQQFSLVTCVCSLSALVITTMELKHPTTTPLNSTMTYNEAAQLRHDLRWSLHGAQQSFVNALQVLSIFCSLFLCCDHFNSRSIFVCLTLFLASGCILN